MADNNADHPTVRDPLNEEQRSRVMDCLAREDLHLLSGPFDRLICDIEDSIADFRASARGGSFREAHDALRRLWELSQEDDLPVGLLRARIQSLPKRAAEHLNRHGPGGIDSEQLRAAQCWEPDAKEIALTTRILAAEGAMIVEGRSRGHGRRSGRRAEPIILGEARGAGPRTHKGGQPKKPTHKGGRPKNADQQELIRFLACDWLRATDRPPACGRSDYRGFGDLVHSVFQWLGLEESATYALRQYWAEIEEGKGYEPTALRHRWDKIESETPWESAEDS
ncbi:MAG: hypothetical protein WB715_25050 [Roseiarcus sp.]|uniref:hypothetical protein n=1 Tax=Roseiarcus sp. TaxID=1969460 RepID=UPI003C42AD37